MYRGSPNRLVSAWACKAAVAPWAAAGGDTAGEALACGLRQFESEEQTALIGDLGTWWEGWEWLSGPHFGSLMPLQGHHYLWNVPCVSTSLSSPAVSFSLLPSKERKSYGGLGTENFQSGEGRDVKEEKPQGCVE